MWAHCFEPDYIERKRCIPWLTVPGISSFVSIQSRYEPTDECKWILSLYPRRKIEIFSIIDRTEMKVMDTMFVNQIKVPTNSFKVCMILIDLTQSLHKIMESGIFIWLYVNVPLTVWRKQFGRCVLGWTSVVISRRCVSYFNCRTNDNVFSSSFFFSADIHVSVVMYMILR